jgi:hypothetical protein
MWSSYLRPALIAAVVLEALNASGHDASAGQFKRLDASRLSIGAQLAVHASPLNSGQAMEMDTYEFLSGRGEPAYRLRIVSNLTGQELHVTWLGVNGTVITSCTAPLGGSCVTPVFQVVGGLLFQGVISTQFGSPVRPGAHYVFAVQRQPVPQGPARPTASAAGVIR